VGETVERAGLLCGCGTDGQHSGRLRSPSMFPLRARSEAAAPGNVMPRPRVNSLVLYILRPLPLRLPLCCEQHQADSRTTNAEAGMVRRGVRCCSVA